MKSDRNISQIIFRNPFLQKCIVWVQVKTNAVMNFRKWIFVELILFGVKFRFFAILEEKTRNDWTCLRHFTKQVRKRVYISAAMSFCSSWDSEKKILNLIETFENFVVISAWYSRSRVTAMVLDLNRTVSYANQSRVVESWNALSNKIKLSSTSYKLI